MPNMGIVKKTLGKPRSSLAGTKPRAKAPAAGVRTKTRKPLVAREGSAPYRVAAQANPLAPSRLADALFTITQQRVLGLLFGDPDRSFFANEIITVTGAGSGAVQRELARLESSGLVTVKWLGNQKHYQANKTSPIFHGLWDIVQNTVGVAAPLKAALHPLAAKIHLAFVYGSLPKKHESAASDIDVMVISDSLSYADLFAALEPVTTRLGRPVNPTVFTKKDLTKRIREGNSFVTRVLAQPKIWLIGGESDLGV